MSQFHFSWPPADNWEALKKAVLKQVVSSFQFFLQENFNCVFQNFSGVLPLPEERGPRPAHVFARLTARQWFRVAVQDHANAAHAIATADRGSSSSNHPLEFHDAEDELQQSKRAKKPGIALVFRSLRSFIRFL